MSRSYHPDVAPKLISGRFARNIFIGLSFGLLSASLLLPACATADHGTFVPNTYRGNDPEQGRQPLGPVKARSCQTRVLYIFPSGPGPSTEEALRRAMNQYEGTGYLADVR